MANGATANEIIYAAMSRVSTDEQNKGNSPKDQLDKILAYASVNNLPLPQEYTFHEDYTGYAFERPELDKIRQLIRERKIQGLIVASGDRLARSVMVAGMLAAEFARYGLELHFVSRGKIDYTSPEGQFIFFMECVGNQYWGAKAKEAMRNGRKAQIAAGIPLGQGPAPYGYRKVGKKRETRLITCDEEVWVVVYIAIKDAEQQREKVKKQLVPAIPEERFRSVATFSARLKQGLNEAKTFEDRLEMIEAIKLTGTLTIKNAKQVVRLHWYAPDDDEDNPTVCVDSGATS